MSHLVMDDNVHTVFHIKIFIVFAILLLQAACSYLPTVPITLYFHSHYYLNPSAGHRSLPVLIRIYQLSDVEQFNDATFNQLWRSAKQTLGESYITEMQFSLYPHSRQHLKIYPQKNSKYIAIMALFHNAGSQYWRIAFTIPNQVKSFMHSKHFLVEGNQLKVINS